ncbi:hypothetical protein BVE84_06830 [Streptococcus azizii]|uniref:Uncharacterized protein n=1 Tax=Streptococcus azizii TaxID=1579424 RepID=A0AB36JLH3_9STRE|nr:MULTISPECIES: hypothetical protein [Streptococcus]MBF0775405.1 hypothetical protein [Streptococcus sp. 19428wD3_AN2]ONK26769.1 hypothetical protein BVE86_06650 [Streptococcus azizii]ONK27336.1 hypothetical protein BVE85_06635 [Streptococcus azizii]ONK28280.1 hypothetical protein BVE84_06830 [Streptococcus azizii]TFU84573.1 hypothetical protein E4T83_01250 [Streptococcus sp. AN2]
MKFVFIVINIFIIFYLLRKLYSINLTEYQGFTTRFFNNRDSKISINTIIFWILLIPFYSIFMYIFLVFLLKDIDFSFIWVISPSFWLMFFIWIILLNRISLVNNLFIFLIGMTSSILNYYLSKTIFSGNLADLEPNASNTSWQLYSLGFLFLVSLIQISYNNEDYLLKRKKYINKKINLYQRKYKLINNLEKDLKCLILAVLIKEDFERPPVIRVFEVIFNTKTRYIAQNDSQNDWHSVYLLIRDILLDTIKAGRKDLDVEMREMIYKINHSKAFVSDVMMLYHEIKYLINEI